jgi:secreted trypsin-like serine protease
VRNRMTTGLLATAVLAAVGLAAAAPAAAITGGTEDTANAYSNVGMLVYYADGGRYRCSGTLVTPTVVLTAAHCTEGTDGATLVTFDPVVARSAADAGKVPRAGNPEAGFTAEEAPAGWHAGTAHTHPGYSGFTDLRNWNDVGVIVLDEAVEGITPARVAPVGHLDQYAQPRLNRTTVRVVGYGTEVRKPTSGPQKPTPMSFPIVRRYADEVGQKLTPQVLQVNGNEKDPRGTGGSCFGDSGGPALLDGVVVTVTSYGYTSNCRYLGGLQRVDIPVVQDWLAEFGVAAAATGRAA